MDKPWWQTDCYDMDVGVMPAFHHHSGPKGLGLVRVWPSGVTDPGWGLQSGFMEKYMRGEFNDRRVLFGYDRNKWALAIIMRSVGLVCFDIDGKNGGLEHAKRLGMLPPTLAETSKSGNGYHLFYSTEEDWDDTLGFAAFNDRIGLEQGVDFRGTGCVYHHDNQRWNSRAPRALPDHLRTLLLHKEQKASASAARIETVLANQDELEVLMLQDEIEADLAKPIDQGKRNTTLFAIGSQMCQAGIDGWEQKLGDRATQVGLSLDETDKIIANISRYSTPAP